MHNLWATDFVRTKFSVIENQFSDIYASVNSKREHPPSRATPGVLHLFSSRVPGICAVWIAMGVGPIIKVPSCQLMLHEGTFQLQTDLPSVDAL